MNKDALTKNIAEKLYESLGKVRFGVITLTLKIHESNVVSISNEITEKTIQKQEVKQNENINL